MFKVSIASAPGNSAVDVAEFIDLDQAVSFGFSLHQASTLVHFIRVYDKSEVIASFRRVQSFVPPVQSDTNGEATQKKGLFKKSK